MAQTRLVKRNQIVIYQGEAVGSVYVIRSGVIRAYSILSNGNEVNIALFGPGDYFPVGALFNTAPVALFYYETMTDCETEVLRLEDFVGRAAEHDELQRSFKRYVGALLHVSALGQATASERVMHTLRYLTMRFGVELSTKLYTRIDLKLTQQDIARLCNVSRETASIELSKLKTAGVIIERNKYYSIHQQLLNKAIGDDATSGLVI